MQLYFTVSWISSKLFLKTAPMLYFMPVLSAKVIFQLYLTITVPFLFIFLFMPNLDEGFLPQPP